MGADKPTFQTIDEYIMQFPDNIQHILKKLREVIKEAAPEAEEKISYQMPTFYLFGNLVHFAVCKNHIGFYPTPSGIETFKKELAEYKSSKGAVQFPIENPLPFNIINEIVKYRVTENLKKAEEKSKKR
jgi:uncharacterized protein YdhG (YjbR/CyaY superfamily)